VTSAGLARRVPKQQTAATPAVETSAASGRPVGRSARSPEEVRHMLSRYRSGLDRGRQADAPDAPDAATGPDDGHAVTTSTPQDGSRP
jgi:hypothetical protein